MLHRMKYKEKDNGFSVQWVSLNGKLVTGQLKIKARRWEHD